MISLMHCYRNLDTACFKDSEIDNLLFGTELARIDAQSKIGPVRPFTDELFRTLQELKCAGRIDDVVILTANPNPRGMYFAFADALVRHAGCSPDLISRRLDRKWVLSNGSKDLDVLAKELYGRTEGVDVRLVDDRFDVVKLGQEHKVIKVTPYCVSYDWSHFEDMIYQDLARQATTYSSAFFKSEWRREASRAKADAMTLHKVEMQKTWAADNALLLAARELEELFPAV